MATTVGRRAGDESHPEYKLVESSFPFWNPDENFCEKTNLVFLTLSSSGTWVGRKGFFSDCSSYSLSWTELLILQLFHHPCGCLNRSSVLLFSPWNLQLTCYWNQSSFTFRERKWLQEGRFLVDIFFAFLEFSWPWKPTAAILQRVFGLITKSNYPSVALWNTEHFGCLFLSWVQFSYWSWASWLGERDTIPLACSVMLPLLLQDELNIPPKESFAGLVKSMNKYLCNWATS